jgi:dipeptidyl aminopeptidase/acylaminoacyl peptidase
MTPTIMNVEFFCQKSQAKLRGRFVLPSRNPDIEKLPLVIVLTGDGPKGTKSLSWTELPPRLAERGVATFLFDFEGLGFSDGVRAKLTLSRGIQNFRSAFDLAIAQPWVDSSRVGILASSFGASVALLTPDIVNQVRLIGLKSPASFIAEAYVNECTFVGVEKWIQNDFSPETGYELEVLTNSLEYNVFTSARQISTPVLITHGDQDAIVPIYQSQLLCTCLSGPKQMEIFSGVGHNYSEEGAWERMAAIFVNWFGTSI